MFEVYLLYKWCRSFFFYLGIQFCVFLRISWNHIFCWVSSALIDIHFLGFWVKKWLKSFCDSWRSWVCVRRAWSASSPFSNVWWSGAKTCTSIQTFRPTWVSDQHKTFLRVRSIRNLQLKVCYSLPGQEHPSDGEGVELKLPEQLAGRRDSISSLDSTVSSIPMSQADHPEQYEVIKQQKDIIEHGIELWVRLTTGGPTSNILPSSMTNIKAETAFHFKTAASTRRRFYLNQFCLSCRS